MEDGIKVSIKGDQYRLDIFNNGEEGQLYYFDRKNKKELLKELDHQIIQLWKREAESDLLMKLILGEPYTDKDLEEKLFEICDRVHSSCDDECPMYRLGFVTQESLRETGNCPFFKDGTKMLKALKRVS